MSESRAHKWHSEAVSLSSRISANDEYNPEFYCLLPFFAFLFFFLSIFFSLFLLNLTSICQCVRLRRNLCTVERFSKVETINPNKSVYRTSLNNSIKLHWKRNNKKKTYLHTYKVRITDEVAAKKKQIFFRNYNTCAWAVSQCNSFELTYN